MSNYKWKKFLRCTLLVLIILAIGTVAAACAKTPATAETTQPTQAVEEEDVTLYFNVDREEYESSGEEGLNGRKKDPDSGYYQILVASKGRVSYRRVADRRVVYKIDSQDVMGLIQDDDGVVTGIIPVEECTGGYYMTGKKVYVSAVNGNVLTVYGNSGLEGKGYTLEYNADTKIYDVSSDAKDSDTQGAVTTVKENDKILAIYNKDGSIGWIYVLDRIKPMETRTRYCDHCKEEVLWYGWNDDESLPVSGEGHYYLTEDVACYGQMSMAQDANIVLDLNGHTVTSGAGRRIYSLHNSGVYLAIMDYSEAKTGQLIAGATTTMENQGACVWVRYGTFELYGGTLDASEVSGKAQGIAVNVPKNSTFRMHGGTIRGGTSKASYNSEKDSYTGGLGGALYVGGTFKMDGGKIVGGIAQGMVSGGKQQRGAGGAVYLAGSGVAYMYGGMISGGIAGGNGGNVFVSSKSSFTMGGTAKIVGGLAANGGGNVYVSGNSAFNMSGSSKISGGACNGKGKNGGSVYISANGVFNMDGGEINGGASKNCGGAMALYGTLNMSDGLITGGKIWDYPTTTEVPSNNENVFCVNGTLNMSGGTITGHVQLVSTGEKNFTANISGTAKIKGAQDGRANLYIPVGKTINVSAMRDGAEVYVTATGIFSTETDEANKQYFHSDSPDASVVYFENCLAVGRVQCDCGASANGEEHIGDCDGTLHLFLPWTSAASLPTTPGHYYLTKDVALGSQMNIKTSGELVLDLNGHTVTSTGGRRIYAMWKDCEATLSIADSSAEKTGKMVASGDSTNQGRIIWLYGANHVLKLYGGTLDASGASGIQGLGICAETQSTLNLFGGKIIGGDAGEKNGGAVYIAKGAVFNMSGGEISGGKTDAFGGNVSIEGGAVMNLTGGTVTDGAAAKNGGNIRIASGGTLNMTGGTISNGSTGDSGGNLVIYGTLNMSDGTITGGKKLDAAGKEKASSSENVFCVNGTMDMSGGTITGHVQLTSTTGKDFNVKLSGTAKIKGAEDGMGNLNIPAGKTIDVGTMTDGAEVYVTASGTFSTVTAKENAQYFHCDNPEITITYNSDRCLEAVGRYQCVCGASVNGGEHIGDCDGTEHMFTAWTKTTELPTTPGYYYLVNDVTVGSQANVKTGGELVLDLNGHTAARAGGARIYALWTGCEATLSIADSSAAKTGKLAVSGDSTNQGRVIWLRDANQTVKLYGGTLDAGKASGGYGLGICTETQSTVNMYGGKIIGGDVGAKNGGAVYIIKNAAFNMSGGEISNGKATNGGNVYIGSGAAFDMTGGTVSGGDATNAGGNVYVDADGVLTMDKDAAITNGTAVNGGNVYVVNTLTMKNGTISGGHATTNGGNVYVGATANFTLNGGTVESGVADNEGGNVWNFGTLTMTGGKISAGKAKNSTTRQGANVNLTATAAATSRFVMSGGEIDGYVYIGVYRKTPSCEISGDAKIMSADGASGIQLYTMDGYDAPFVAIADGFAGKIRVDTANPDGYRIATASADAYADKIVVKDGYFVFYENGGYTLYDSSKYRAQCICGASVNGGTHIGDCDGTKHLFTAWTDTASLPVTPGYYFLTQDVKVGKQMSVSTSGELVLDLNGHTVTRGARIYALQTGCKVTLSITDSSAAKTGKMTVSGTGDQGRIIWLRANHTVNLYGGTLDAGKASGGYGLGICTETQSTVNMYGGKIIGGDVGAKNGGAVYIKNAAFNMSGGEISGGKATNGGNVYVGSNAAFRMSGGAVSGGNATESGGNAYVDAGGVMTMDEDAAITDGNAKNGGNIFVVNTLTVENGTISGGHASNNGGNVYVGATANFTLNGGTVESGVADNEGGNVWNFGTLTMTGGKISAGKAKNSTTRQGANVNLTATSAATSKFVMSGGEIEGYVYIGVYQKTPSCEISGDAKIMSADGTSGILLYTKDGFEAPFVAIADGFAGKIRVDTQNPDGYRIAAASADAYADNIVVKEGYFAFYENGGYTLYDSSKYRVQCICGASVNGGEHTGDCDGTKHPFMAWTKTAELPTTPGYYYLTVDVTVGSQMNAKTSGELVLDLNGHTVTRAGGGRIYALWTGCKVTLSIADSSAEHTGKMAVSGNSSNQGRIIWLRSDHELNLYGVTLDASGASGSNGLGICSEAQSTINMYGGRVIGGDAGAKNGGALHITKGTMFNVYGGEISGGKATNGGNVYIGSGAAFNLSGGTVSGGDATGNGSNVYVEAGSTLAWIGGTIADYETSIWAAEGATVEYPAGIQTVEIETEEETPVAVGEPEGDKPEENKPAQSGAAEGTPEKEEAAAPAEAAAALEEAGEHEK